jgi:hypothetical protein
MPASPALPQFTGDNPAVPVSGAAGTPTQDRRIMSPGGQQPSLPWLTWADRGSSDHAQADFGTYLA